MKFTKLDEISNQRAVYELLIDSDNTHYNIDSEKFLVDHIFNQSILENLIENSSKDHIREQCVKRIYSRKYLCNLVSNDLSWRIKLIAICELLLNSSFYKVCNEILENSGYNDYISLNNLESIAKNDKDWKNRLVACLIISDKPTLEYIAINDECKYLRIAAIFAIDNNDRLIEIIKNDSDFDVIDIACKRLHDESALIEIYNSRITDIRKKAIIGNIHDQFFLIEKIYGSSNWAVSQEASNNIYNPIELMDLIVGKQFQSKYVPPARLISFPEDYVYFEDLMVHIRPLIMDDVLQADLAITHGKGYMNAIVNIGDPKIYNELLNNLDYDYFVSGFDRKLIFEDTLFNMALNHHSEEVRFESVLRIFDKFQLKEIIDNESSEKVKNQALRNITLDDNEFKLNTNDRFVRGEVVKSLKDITNLVKIICYSHDEYLTVVALNNIKDKELLVDIACAFPYAFYGLAVSKINDDGLLAEVAINAIDEFNATYAVTKIKDDACLVHVLNSSPHPRCYPYAILRISDQMILKDIAYNHEDDYLRDVALSKITSQDILKDFALNDSNFHVRIQAVKNITDESFLKEIAINDNNFFVRITAKRTIESFLE